MVRRGVLGWILTAVLLGGVCLIAASTEAQAVGGGNGLLDGPALEPSPQAPGPEAPVPIGTLWQEFEFSGVGVSATGCGACTPSSGGNSQFAPAAPWTFTAPAQGAILTVTDAFTLGDVFNVFDFGFPIGSTTVVGAGGSCGSDPVVCLGDPLTSHGVFFLVPGPHSITIVPSASPFGAGAAYFRVDTAGVLLNISTRGQVQTGDNVLIGGFVVSGSVPVVVLIRALGPSLASFGVPGVLPDPIVTLFSGSTAIAQNNNWQVADPLCASTGNTCGTPADIAATGLAPTNPLESAIEIILPPGPYTAIVTGFGGSTGVGLIEVYYLLSLF